MILQKEQKLRCSVQFNLKFIFQSCPYSLGADIFALRGADFCALSGADAPDAGTDGQQCGRDRVAVQA